MLQAAPVRLWAMLGAGPPLTMMVGALVWIVWRGGWPASAADRQLQILGFALYGCLSLIGVIVISLASVKVRAQAMGGAALEIDADDSSKISKEAKS